MILSCESIFGFTMRPGYKLTIYSVHFAVIVDSAEKLIITYFLWTLSVRWPVCWDILTATLITSLIIKNS